MTLGLYTHIPFCTAKCSYCHFVSYPYRQTTAARYQRAVLKEIATTPLPEEASWDVDTVYLGGGTPSLVPVGFISGILKAFRNRFHILENCEISMEANPETLISKRKIEAYRTCGINRISLGAQSFVARELEAIGRKHSSAMIRKAVEELRRADFRNISLDLILGLPFQTKESWTHTLDTLVGLEIPHVSVYMLDLNDPCPLSDLVDQGLTSVPDDDFLADMYMKTVDFLAARGYCQYEISNFAMPGYACRHNLKYWQRDPVLGFGLASHSFNGKERYANRSQMTLYLEAVEKNQDAATCREGIRAEQALQETLFLGLRMNEGVNWTALRQMYGAEATAKYSTYIQELCAQNLAQSEDGRVRLTLRGMLLSNEIFQYFV
ncbi:MAG: radical SAM family heme chaperone HemW [Acidobacteriota bacterium]|nr:radical SAM family heme chaperone HemW [Acidobacteriota bacterium]